MKILITILILLTTFNLLKTPPAPIILMEQEHKNTTEQLAYINYYNVCMGFNNDFVPSLECWVEEDGSYYDENKEIQTLTNLNKI